jgi:trehalose synthase-fused probable maltokinase
VRGAVALLGERLDAGLADELPDGAREVAVDLAARAGVVLEDVDALVAAVGDDAGATVRHHGDYHLGQVLRGGDGALYVIDFEGEPARPLEARRARHSAARDVAGMLRSFAYAASAGELQRGTPAPEGWEERAREAFLAGYFGAVDASLLPPGEANARTLLTVFELEKAVYELRYELNNRPDWVGIPVAGIARLLEEPLP